MQSVTAIVRPYLVERILERLKLEPIEALHISEVQGYGRQKDYLEEYDDAEFQSVFLPKVEIRIFVKRNRCNEVIDVLLQTARSGRIGDGKVFVVPVERGIDIQTYQG
jgi:nitrogen regulatory protein PII